MGGRKKRGQPALFPTPSAFQPQYCAEGLKYQPSLILLPLFSPQTEELYKPISVSTNVTTAFYVPIPPRTNTFTSLPLCHYPYREYTV